MKKWPALLALALGIAGCSWLAPKPVGAPGEYSGTYDRICSPVDASGIELRLERQGASNGAPLVLIQLWTPQLAVNAEPLKLDGELEDGTILRCRSQSDCQQVPRGYLLIESMAGSYPEKGIFWSADGQLHGVFNAIPGQSSPPICG
jgi:hypothetical protein